MSWCLQLTPKCIKGEKEQMQQYCLKKSCWVQSQYTQIHFIYVYLKKDAFRGLEGPDPRCFRKTPCHCCPAHGTLGGAQKGQPSAVLVFALFVAGQGEGRVCLLRCSRKECLHLPGCLSLHPETQKGSWGLQEGAGRGNQSRSLVANADMLGPRGHWEFAVIKPFLNKETEAKKE